MDLTAIKEIVSSSNTITTWSLSLLGASLLAILSTSYIKPIGKWSKLIYLLFAAGWFFLGKSIVNGDCLVRRSIMAFINQERIQIIGEKMNDEFALQLNNFKLSLLFFGIWLFLYLLWWVFQDFIIKTNKQ
jgi:hypothetical protein